VSTNAIGSNSRSVSPVLPKGATKAAESCIKFASVAVIKLTIDIKIVFAFKIIGHPVMTLDDRPGDIRDMIVGSVLPNNAVDLRIVEIRVR
jgi:hypothetical protein